VFFFFSEREHRPWSHASLSARRAAFGRWWWWRRVAGLAYYLPTLPLLSSAPTPVVSYPVMDGSIDAIECRVVMW